MEGNYKHPVTFAMTLTSAASVGTSGEENVEKNCGTFDIASSISSQNDFLEFPLPIANGRETGQKEDVVFQLSDGSSSTQDMPSVFLNGRCTRAKKYFSTSLGRRSVALDDCAFLEDEDKNELVGPTRRWSSQPRSYRGARRENSAQRRLIRRIPTADTTDGETSGMGSSVDEVIESSTESEASPAFCSLRPTSCLKPTVTSPSFIRKRRGGWLKCRKRKPDLANSKAPKAPTTAYVLFLNERRQLYKESHPNLPNQEVTKLLGAEWSDMTAEEKSVYIARSDLDKKRYRNELQAYRQSHDYQLQLRKKRIKNAMKGGTTTTEESSDLSDEFDDDGEELHCRICNQWFVTSHNKREHLYGKQHLGTLALQYRKERMGVSLNSSGSGKFSYSTNSLSESDQSSEVSGQAFFSPRLNSYARGFTNNVNFSNDFTQASVKNTAVKSTGIQKADLSSHSKADSREKAVPYTDPASWRDSKEATGVISTTEDDFEEEENDFCSENDLLGLPGEKLQEQPISQPCSENTFTVSVSEDEESEYDDEMTEEEGNSSSEQVSETLNAILPKILDREQELRSLRRRREKCRLNQQRINSTISYLENRQQQLRVKKLQMCKEEQSVRDKINKLYQLHQLFNVTKTQECLDVNQRSLRTVDLGTKEKGKVLCEDIKMSEEKDSESLQFYSKFCANKKDVGSKKIGPPRSNSSEKNLALAKCELNVFEESSAGQMSKSNSYVMCTKMNVKPLNSGEDRERPWYKKSQVGKKSVIFIDKEKLSEKIKGIDSGSDTEKVNPLKIRWVQAKDRNKEIFDNEKEQCQNTSSGVSQKLKIPIILNKPIQIRSVSLPSFGDTSAILNSCDSGSSGVAQTPIDYRPNNSGTSTCAKSKGAGSYGTSWAIQSCEPGKSRTIEVINRKPVNLVSLSAVLNSPGLLAKSQTRLVRDEQQETLNKIGSLNLQSDRSSKLWSSQSNLIQPTNSMSSIGTHSVQASCPFASENNSTDFFSKCDIESSGSMPRDKFIFENSETENNGKQGSLLSQNCDKPTVENVIHDIHLNWCDYLSCDSPRLDPAELNVLDEVNDQNLDIPPLYLGDLESDEIFENILKDS